VDSELQKERNVDVAIVGAQRCGTTWLAESLSQHPEICLARGKEAHFFDSQDVQSVGLSHELFQSSFSTLKSGQLALDATPSYMYLPGSLEALSRHNPQVKVITILRDPGQRAISHYYHSKWRGVENLNLASALIAEQGRLGHHKSDSLAEQSPQRNWSYVSRGRYHTQILRLLALFPQSMVIPFPLMTTHPQQVLTSIQTYLQLNVVDLPILPTLNATPVRDPHRLLASCISTWVKNDTQATLEILGWGKTALLEKRNR
jgi:hypothetical protein